MKKLFLSTLLLLVCTLNAFSQAPGSGYALDFNASGDYLSIPDNPALNPTTAFTLEAWIKSDSWSVNSWGNVIISKDGWGSGEAGYTLRCGANGTASFMLGTTTSWKEVLSSPQMVLGQWYHLAGTFDGTQLKLYINGVLSGTTNYAGVALASPYSLSIGRITYTAGGTRNFDGQIDEVRIWNTALSQATIQANLTKKVTATHPNYANLAGYWKMDEGAGNTIADSGPNNLTGSRLGASAWGLSGAAIGDENVVSYSSPSNLTFTNTDGSTFTTQITSGSPTGLHVYAVHQTPNTTNENLSGALETSHYFGTFLVGGTNPVYSVNYNYAGVTNLTAAPNEEQIRLTYRADNRGTLWSRLTNQFQLDTLGNTVSKCGISARREFAAGFDAALYAISNSTICQGDTLLYFGQNLTSAGLYTHVSTATNGCDSTVGLQLSVTPSVFGSDSATICSGDSVILGNQILSSTGTYTAVLQASSGCDSVVSFQLTVTPPMTTIIFDTICNGDVYVLGTQSLTQAGNYAEIFSAVSGCDSLVELTLMTRFVDTTVTVNGNVITANFAATSYQWLNCDNGFGQIPSQNSQSFAVGSNGNYAVIVSDGVCSDTSGCHFVLAVGLQAANHTGIQLYPNPTTATLHVQNMTGAAIGNWKLLAVDGRTVMADNSQADDATLDLSLLKAGMYFLHVEVDGQMTVLKVIKQ